MEPHYARWRSHRTGPPGTHEEVGVLSLRPVKSGLVPQRPQAQPSLRLFDAGEREDQHQHQHRATGTRHASRPPNARDKRAKPINGRFFTLFILTATRTPLTTLSSHPCSCTSSSSSSSKLAAVLRPTYTACTNLYSSTRHLFRSSAFLISSHAMPCHLISSPLISPLSASLYLEWMPHSVFSEPSLFFIPSNRPDRSPP